VKLLRGLGRTMTSAAIDLVAIARGLLAWPIRIGLRTAEVVGRVVLPLWRSAVLPAVRVARRASSSVLRVAERVITPARGLAVVALAAAIALGASQFSDYHAVEVGARGYHGIENIAPAPRIEQATSRSAHGVSVLAIAIASLLVTALAVAKNYRLARLLIFLGAAVVAISLAVDLHQGLREGAAGLAYQGVKAVLLGGFWVQLCSGITLMIVGPLLAAQLRGERRARRSRLRSRIAPAGVATGSPASRASGVEGAAT
jgi:hypothetical protein